MDVLCKQIAKVARRSTFGEIIATLSRVRTNTKKKGGVGVKKLASLSTQTFSLFLFCTKSESECQLHTDRVAASAAYRSAALVCCESQD